MRYYVKMYKILKDLRENIAMSNALVQWRTLWVKWSLKKIWVVVDRWL
jgi:hypothetical protein